MTREELQRLYSECVSRAFRAEQLAGLVRGVERFLAEPDPTVEIAYLKAKVLLYPGQCCDGYCIESEDGRDAVAHGLEGSVSDLNLITSAPTWLAELLAENERLSVELERSREQYGYAVDRVQHHQERAEKAEQAIQRVRWQCDSWSHGNSWNKAARNAILRALDGGAS